MSMSDTSYNTDQGRNGATAPLAEQAKQVASDVKSAASAAAESVTQSTKQEADEIGAAAKEIFEDATAKVKSAVADQKTASADYLDNVARAIHRAAREFETDVPQAARYIRRASGQISTISTAVRQRDIRELVTEVENVARREPALFFGGAVVLGFAALRFLKSAPPKPIDHKV